RAAFRRSTTYADMVKSKNRCVRIVYANDCHIDVVPHLVLESGRQVIVNSDEDKFEDTNPQGFTAWMKEKDDLANRDLRKVIRLLKYLRDSKQTFSVPSVILTALLGERVQAWDEASRYADVPTTLLNVMLDLKAWLSLYATMPLIDDPSCPGTNFNHRWDQDRYANFRKWMSFYADRIEVAYHEEDKAKSLAAWQQVFGFAFQQPVVKVAAAEGAPASKALVVRAPHEEFIEEMGFRFVGAIGPGSSAPSTGRPAFGMGRSDRCEWLTRDASCVFG
ncbi:MAG: SMODS domain-containing nucleotidyltransferase, partial [Gaiellales bacterium]